MRNLLKVGLRRLVSGAEPGSPRHAAGDRAAVVLAVAAQKGGVGKTTTAVSLASALARFHDKRVLIVDLDPQGHVSTALGATIPKGGGSLAKVLEDEHGAEVLDAVVPSGVPGLDATPFDAGLAATEDLLGARIGKEFILRDKLRVTRTHYDVIVIDCPPNQGNLTVNGLVAADQVLIPCDPSPLALKGVSALISTVQTIAMRLNPSIDLLGVLLTRVDGRNTILNDAIVAEIDRDYGEALLPVRIGIAASIAKAQHAGLDIFGFEPDGRAASQYRALADHVAGLLG
ncbi:MAG: AAA family ATPase [Myxococcota bacterium]